METDTTPPCTDADRQRIINEAAYRVSFLHWLCGRLLMHEDDIGIRREAVAVIKHFMEGINGHD